MWELFSYSAVDKSFLFLDKRQVIFREFGCEKFTQTIQDEVQMEKNMYQLTSGGKFTHTSRLFEIQRNTDHLPWSLIGGECDRTYVSWKVGEIPWKQLRISAKDIALDQTSQWIYTNIPKFVPRTNICRMDWQWYSWIMLPKWWLLVG